MIYVNSVTAKPNATVSPSDNTSDGDNLATKSTSYDNSAPDDYIADDDIADLIDRQVRRTLNNMKYTNGKR